MIQGICLNCNHEHKRERFCYERIVFGRLHVCFGSNPRTETEYSSCFCHEFRSLKTATDPLELLNCLSEFFSTEIENKTSEWLDSMKGQSIVFHARYFLEHGRRFGSNFSKPFEVKNDVS